MINRLVKFILYFFGLVLVQILILNNVQLSGYINPYVYVLFILILPFETPGWLILVSAFMLGISMDVFPQGIAGGGSTLGIHTSATLLVAFLRPLVLRWINTRGEYEKGTEPRARDYGFPWYFLYAVIIIGIHHFVLFYLEDYSILHFFRTFVRFLFSLFFTLLLVLIWEALRYKPRLN